MVIEKAKVEDLNEILELQKLAFLAEAHIYNNHHLPPLEQTIENIREEINEKIFLKACENNKIIGSVRASISDANTCYVGRLVVHPEFQNRGVGGQLMKEIEKYFPAAKRFELFTGNKSKKNIYLYKKMGYQIIREVDSDMEIKLVYMEKLQ
jgi:ribosomal protein S18 acetylase RimI-like enzyme